MRAATTSHAELGKRLEALDLASSGGPGGAGSGGKGGPGGSPPLDRLGLAPGVGACWREAPGAEREWRTEEERTRAAYTQCAPPPLAPGPRRQ